eukprot:11157477-Lingulodinium_polyedra.AAC.1
MPPHKPAWRLALPSLVRHLVQLDIPERLHAPREGSLSRSNAPSGGSLIGGLVEPPPDSDPLGGARVTRGAVEH